MRAEAIKLLKKKGYIAITKDNTIADIMVEFCDVQNKEAHKRIEELRTENLKLINQNCDHCGC